MASLQYPAPSAAGLKLNYLGQHVSSLPTPAAIIDAAVVRRNCAFMHDAVRSLDVGFRAHVKTHKTVELAQLQVGRDTKDIRLLVSTVAEAEHLVPWLVERRTQGAKVNIIYGLPVAPSTVPRLAQVAHLLGPGSVTLLVDHPQQVVHVQEFVRSNKNAWPGPVSVVVKIDAGYHRAGIKPGSDVLSKIASAAADQTLVSIAGVYAHMGHSYSSSSPTEALNFLKGELSEALAGAEALQSHLSEPPKQGMIISIGATPTATATQTLLASDEGGEVAKLIASIKQRFQLEIHAGVYPVLDMQQLATAARPATIDKQSRLKTENIAIRIMVEVASLYDERDKPEALICAGSIVLGREPCKSYPGWGVLTPWSQHAGEEQSRIYDPTSDKTGWIVGRISQEHGILTWEGPPVGVRQLEIGQKVMVWPNHACMAGPSFGWYFVVDSDSDDKDIVRDVWIRCRGW
ncbi:hypothetical protein K461DRAFT_222633 [Myriangium duriaei CBS 260.36]|uniref:D-serine dehydratase n=1 Tax=Myriangium duriaei CBS 260.36 TaxID=1168546 RepID=A0A9P4MHY8_9PEZI|nr:hypothetical protein K461DRAFT_222633 [Myriangium duriaei CBS 260.36]